LDRRVAREKKFTGEWTQAINYLETKGIFETSITSASEASNIKNSTINNNPTRKSSKSSVKNDFESVESTPLNGEDEPYYAWICPSCVSSETRGSHVLTGLGVKIWWGTDMNYQKGLITSYDEPSGLPHTYCHSISPNTQYIHMHMCTSMYKF
jgi:hypothetical protein